MNDYGTEINTPAFIIDEHLIGDNLNRILELISGTDCRLLYSIKALPLQSVLEVIRPFISGFSVSSLNEATLAAAVLRQGSIHLTTPGLRDFECAALDACCSHISFNSLSQFARLSGQLPTVSKGLRINPRLSFAKDERFDPCRQHSKLGVDMRLIEQHGLPETIEGLHFHTVFSCKTVDALTQMVEKTRPLLSKYRKQLKWLNLGGGYLYSEIDRPEIFKQTVQSLADDFNLQVFIEPGKAVVDSAAFLLTRVLDCFDSEGKTVVILDTSVNHHPEVFEYQKSPRLENLAAGDKSVILAGSSCLAGDLFGEYRLKQVPEVGDTIIFSHVGAYSLIKANRFNGYNLPDIYQLNGKQLMHIKSDNNHYQQQWMTGNC